MSQGEVKRKQIQYYSYIIGVILFIFFSKKIGNNGIMYLAIAIEYIAIFVTFLGDYFADVYGRMIRYRRKRNQYNDVRILKKRIIIYQLILGIVSFLIAFFGAEYISAILFGAARAALVIRILSPVLLLKTISSLLTGYFQSFGMQIISAISTLCRQVLFGVFGNLFCTRFLEYGQKVSALLKDPDCKGFYGAIGLCLAILLTDVIILVSLCIYYFLSDTGIDKKRSSRGVSPSEKLFDTIMSLSYLNLQNSVIWVFKRLLVFLPLIICVDFERRGIFYGKFLAVFSIPLLLLVSRYQLFYARLVSAIKNRENRMIRDYIQVGVQYTWVVGIFVATLFAVLAAQISESFFENDILLTGLLQKGALLFVFLTLFAYFYLVHAANNKKTECFIGILSNGILYVILSYFFYGKLDQSLEAFIYAGIISFLVGTLILGISVIIQLHIRLDFIPIFILPLICVGVTGIILLFICKYLTPHIGALLCVILSLIIGMVIYLASLGLCRVFTEMEIEKIYGKFAHKLLSVIFK